VKTKKVCTASSEFLQELSRDLKPITQRELEDFLKTRAVAFSKAFQAARDRYEDLQDTIGARMQVGVPVEPGRLTARLFAGVVLVTDEQKEEQRKPSKSKSLA
jgi:hypothetical protein